MGPFERPTPFPPALPAERDRVGGYDDQCHRIPRDGRRTPSPRRHVPLARIPRTALDPGTTIPGACRAGGTIAPAGHAAACERTSIHVSLIASRRSLRLRRAPRRTDCALAARECRG